MEDDERGPLGVTGESVRDKGDPQRLSGSIREVQGGSGCDRNGGRNAKSSLRPDWRSLLSFYTTVTSYKV